ncbi:MAG TPA: protein YgfX [Burkholderiales bacterium]|nr:protein YgfX [Burkholderiales bacterium]
MSRGPLLRLELRPSRALAVVLGLVHAAGAACVLVVAGAGTAGPALAALLLGLGAATIRDRALLRGGGAVRAIELGGEGAAALELADGRRLAGRVHGRRHVSRLWVTLPLRGSPHRSVLVAADMLAPAAFRQLRLWALWGRVARGGRA